MGVFADESEVYEYLGEIFRIGTKKDGLSEKLAASGVVLRIHYTDPDAVVTVDMPAETVETGRASVATPTVELHMSADTGNRFWLGKVNLAMALAKGTVRAKGSTPRLLKLIPMSKELFPEYRRLLEERGRTDLLNA
ncbi:SCP2 sterol-binding domain-containing protein [Actinomycetospora soli]|uniref:SCP2 sterol-binding domain-containing protein n=1 Tax=Actinomycetospora soli TaxID=2893887 RepID=UPI001E45F26A|nr:SCP2 sterol-binding domain-containing protein [Actinomycetospora soli]MCD2188109.1 SCP2 sterol-binding domain-containing protein [Actinomycetospora soli]